MTSITFKELVRVATQQDEPSDETLGAQTEQWHNQPESRDTWSVRDALMTQTLPAVTRRWLGLHTKSKRAEGIETTSDERIRAAVAGALKNPAPCGEGRASRAQAARLQVLVARQNMPDTVGLVAARPRDIVIYQQQCLAFATQACGLRGEAVNVGRALKKYLAYGGEIAAAKTLLAEAAAQLCKAESTVKDVLLAFTLWNVAAPFVRETPTPRFRAIQKQLWETWKESPFLYGGDMPLRPLGGETPLLAKHTVNSLKNRYPDPESVPAIPEAVSQFAKQLLHAAELPITNIKGRKLLLAGPPGSGKSFLAYVVGRQAAERNIPMLEIHCSDVLDKYQGGTLANLRAVFAELEEHGKSKKTPVLLFLDEAEQLLGARTTDSREQGSIITTLLHFLDKHPQVFVIAATNCAELLDHAAQQAFDYTVQKGLSGAKDLVEIMANGAAGATPWTPQERRGLTALAMGLSPRDVVFASSKARERHLRQDASQTFTRALAHTLVDAQLNRTRTFDTRMLPVADGIVWDLGIKGFSHHVATTPPGDYFSLMLPFHDTVWELSVQSKRSFLRHIRGPNPMVGRWGMTHDRLTLEQYEPSMETLLGCVDANGDLCVRLGLEIAPDALSPVETQEAVKGLGRFTDP